MEYPFFFGALSSRSASTHNDLLPLDTESFLDEWRREREEERRRIYNPYISFQSEEIEIQPKKVNKKSINPNYPICPE